MKNPKKPIPPTWHHRFRLLLLFLAVLSRLALACLNRGANDDHLEVSRLLFSSYADEAFQPNLFTCLECYHPKLYHTLVAALYCLFDINSDTVQVILAQLVNAAAGIGTLWYVLTFTERWNASQSAKTAAFGLIALNPSLLLINVQATNDSFAIFFGVAATFYLHLFLQHPRRLYLAAGSGLAYAALLTKGSALSLAVWIGAVLAIKAMAECILRGRSRPWATALALFSIGTVVVLSAVPAPFSTYRSYVQRWQETGNFAAVNFDPAPPPAFFERTFTNRPGVISIADSYLSFRWLDLIENPMLQLTDDLKPFHRSSLWSQLYGRFHFSYFANWVWQRDDAPAVAVGRALMAAGLLPSLMMAAGFLALLWRAFAALCAERQYFAREREWIFPLQSLAYLYLIIAFNLAHRDFCAMKDIYILPGLLSYIAAFLTCCSLLQARFKTTWISRLALSGVWLVVLLYMANLGLVLEQFLRP